MLALAMAVTPTWGACSAAYLIKHNASTSSYWATTDQDATNGFDTSVSPSVYLWDAGAGTSNNIGTCTGAANQVRKFGVTPTQRYIYNAGASWVNGCMNNCPGTPPAASDRNYIVAYQVLNTGTATHSLRWLLASAMFNTGGTGRYELMTINNGQQGGGLICVPVNMTPTIGGSSHVGNSWTFTINWTAPGGGGTNGSNGFYYTGDLGTAPITGPIVQSYEIYYRISASAPDDTLASWTLGYTAPGTAVTTGANVNLTWDGNTALYFAMRPVFNIDTTKRATWAPPVVGGNSIQVGPTSSGVFASMSASATGNNVNVTWTSNVEDGSPSVVNYQTYYATTSAGPFQPIGGAVSAAGNGHVYNSPFTMPGTKASGVVYVKVAANMSNSTQQWSSLKKVAYGVGTSK